MPGDVTIDVRAAAAKLNLAQAGIHQAAALALNAAMEVAEKSAKGTTLWQDRTGNTRGSIRSERTRPTRGFVEARFASIFLENGTAPHWIGANVNINGHWVWIGMHPGTTARPFMAIAAREAQQAAEYAAEFYVDFAMRRV